MLPSAATFKLPSRKRGRGCVTANLHTPLSRFLEGNHKRLKFLYIELGLRQLKTCRGRSRLLTAIGNAQRCARAGRQQELAPTKNIEIPIRKLGLRRLFNVERRGSSLYKHNFEIPEHIFSDYLLY